MNGRSTPRRARTRLASLSLLILGLTASPFIGPAAADRRESLRGSYTVNAAPAPDGTVTYCGQAPYNKSPHPLDVPASGLMTVTLDGFRGNRDVWLETDAGNYVDGSFTSDGLTDNRAVEKITTYLKEPGRYVIWVGNWAGGPEARVTYEVLFGPRKALVAQPDVLLHERVPVQLRPRGLRARRCSYGRFPRRVAEGITPGRTFANRGVLGGGCPPDPLHVRSQSPS